MYRFSIAATALSRLNVWSGLPVVAMAAATLGCQSPIPNFGGSTLESATRVPPPPTGSYAVPGSYDSGQRIGDTSPRGADVGYRISDAGQRLPESVSAGSSPMSGVVPASGGPGSSVTDSRGPSGVVSAGGWPADESAAGSYGSSAGQMPQQPPFQPSERGAERQADSQWDQQVEQPSWKLPGQP